MSKAFSKQVTVRLLAGAFCVLLIVSLFLADRYRGGDTIRRYACVLTNSKLTDADDSVLMFGSSRSVAAFDHFYINNIFRNEPGMQDKNIQRFALTGRDSVSAYFLLENRLKNGRAPELIILELMLGTPSMQVRDEAVTGLRHVALLDYEQLERRLSDFGRARSEFKLFDYAVTYVNRTTALIYGLIEHPGQAFWNPELCDQPSDWTWRSFKTENGNRAAEGTAEQEIIRSQVILEENYDQSFRELRRASKWKQNSKRRKRRKNNYAKRGANYLNHAYANLQHPAFRQEINDIKQTIQLAQEHGVTVVVLPFKEKAGALTKKERSGIAKTFSGLDIFVVDEQYLPVLNAYWEDPVHLSHQGSMLASALLAKYLSDELRSD